MGSYIALGITLIIAITVHEFAHALAADTLGDPTPRNQGRLTLNPLAHLDLMGSLFFIFSGFGWGKPVQSNPYQYTVSPRTGLAIVAAAGPFSNLLLAIFAAIPFRAGFVDLAFEYYGGSFIPSLSEFLYTFIAANIGLMFFNLIPVAPLDGFKVALGVLPDEWARALAQLEQYGPFILLLLLMSGRFGFDVFGLLIGGPQDRLISLLLGW